MENNLAVKTFPERILQRIPIPYWISIILFWSFEPAFDYLYLMRLPVPEDYLGAHLGMLLFFAAVTITLIYSSHVLWKLFPDLALIVGDPTDKFGEWYLARLRNALSGWGPVASGIIFVVVWELTVQGIVQSSVTYDEPVLQILWIGYLLIGFFILGYGVWSLLWVAMIPHGLLLFNPKVSLNQIAGIGLQALGSTYFKIALANSACFLILILTVLASPLSGKPEVLAWEVVGALVIFGFFVIPQYGVHKIMAAEKKRSLSMLSQPIDAAIRQSLHNPSSENNGRLKELMDLQAAIRGMNDWPFNVNTMWQLISALLIPLLLAVIEIVNK